MKKWIVAGLVIAASLAPPSANATVWTNKKVIALLTDTRACVFFRLEGVAEADPVVPSQPWFALSTTHPNFQTIYAALLSAKAAGMLVEVTTSGSSACGLASIAGVQIP